MAYGLYLYKEINSKSGKTIRLEIFQKDYSGSSIEIESMSGTPLSLVIDNANSGVYLPIVKSFLNINIIDTEQIDYSVFFTPDATKFKVILKVNGTAEWSGYLTPDSFSQSLQYRSEINLTARDNLGMLSEFDYDLTNRFYSISTLINTALTKIGFQFTLDIRTKKVDSANETIINGLTQTSFWIGKTWQEVLETILTGIGCQLRYVGGNKYAIFDIGYLDTLGSTEVAQSFAFIEQSGVQEIIPAWKEIVISQDYGKTDNAYDGHIEETDFEFESNKGGDETNPYNFYQRPFYNIPLSSDWTSSISMLNPYEYKNLDVNDIYITGKSAETTLFMGSQLTYGKRFEAINDGKAIQFKFKASNYPYFISRRRSGEYMVEPMLRARYLYEMKVRCNLFAQTATDKYVLQGRNWIIWTSGYSDALEFTLPQTKESNIYGKIGTEMTSQMDSPQEQAITIEAFGLGLDAYVYIEFYPYTATYTEVSGLGNVDDYPAIVYDVHTMKLSDFEIRIIENEFGGLETKTTINANHNINGSIELSLGQVPRGLGGYNSYLGGIFKNSNPYYPPMYDFHFTGGTNYTLSELIGREIAHHFKTQRKKLSGNIINSENFTAMPSFAKPFTDGTLTYALNYGSLDLQNEVMQVEMIEVEPYLYEDFTFVEATIESGGGSSMGAGEKTFVQWSAAGNAKRIYELDTASEADQGGAYVVIDKSELASAKKVALIDLLVDAYTKTESDSRFASIDGDLTQDFSAKKLTTATLLLPQSAPTLDSGEVGIYSLDSGFSGELPSGAGSVTSIALTMPTGFAVSGSPITESGTFGVTFASGYFLPTTTQFATKLDVSLKGTPNGLAELDENGFVKNTQLPSYVDDVLEYGYFSELPVMGTSGKIYVITNPLDTDHYNKTYRWSGTIYTEISQSLALGETSSTAYRGDRGKIAYDHSQLTGNPHGATTTNISEGTNLYYTDARVKAHGDTLYTPIAHGQITSGNPHGTTAAQVGALALTGGVLSGVVTTLGGFDGTFLESIRFANTGYPSSYTNAIFSTQSLDASASFLEFRLSNGKTTRNTALKLGNLLSIFSGAVTLTKLTSTTLLLPQTAPTLASGELAIYGLESGFSGELPSGAGSVDSVALVSNLTGISVTGSPITTSGTFTLNFVSGYQLMTTTESTKLAGIAANANNYSLPIATASDLGGVKIGSNITITDGVISVAAPHNAVTLGTANGLSLATQVLSLGLASATTNGALSSTDWNTFNGKQAKLIGTGASSLVRVNTSGVIAYDDSTYLTGNQTITLSGIITGSGTTAITTSIADNALSIAKTNGLQTALDSKMATASYPDLVAIEALTGTSGFLKKTAANTWSLDTNTYLTTTSASSTYLPLIGGEASGNIHHNYDYARTIYGNLGADGDVHIGSSGSAAALSGDYGFYTAYNAYRHTDGKWYQSRGSVGSWLFKGGLHNGGFSWLTAAASGASELGFTELMKLSTNGNLTLTAALSGVTTLGASGVVTLSNTTQSTTYTNGGLVLSGGLGIAKDLYSNGKAVFASSVQMLENINTNLRIPKVAPTNPTSGQYYFYIVE